MPAPTRLVDYIGLTLKDRYKVIRKLGSGGFATVYEAHDLALLSRSVVVKVLHVHKVDDWLLRKFQQEKEALIRIDDPGVVTILDEGITPERTPFLVIQFADGVTLSELVKQGKMDFARAAGIFRQIGSALESAHRKGVFHRDLKPDNIMVQTTASADRVRLIDFGIANIADSVYSSTRHSTRIAGTVSYMPPEQLSGGLSAQVDIYAFGAVAFEVLAGVLAVKNPVELVAMAKGTLETKLRQFRADIPDDTVGIVAKALSVSPAERYASAREMGDALAQSLTTIRPAPPPPPQRPRLARRLLLASLLVAVGVGGWFGYRNSNSPAPQHQPPPQPIAGLRLDYTATLHAPNGENRTLPGVPALPKNYGVAIEVVPPEPGYLYIVNEGPLPSGGRSINILYPAYRAPAQINAGQSIRIPKQQWFELDEASGTESLYLVWSRNSVPAFEAAKDQADALTDRGISIRDAAQRASLMQILTTFQVQNTQVSQGDQKTSLTSNEDVLVHLIRLEHL